MRQSDLRSQEQQVQTQQLRMQQERATLESARYDLSKVRIESPINGIVTRRNIEEGETVVIGTMNNAGTVLLTIADMSVIEAEVEVDETDIPTVKLGQIAKITIDAMPDKTFTGKVTEIGNSPIQAAGPGGERAGDELQSGGARSIRKIPEVRPGFTCTAEITTATREERGLACRSRRRRSARWSSTTKGEIVREPVTEPKQRPRPGAVADARTQARSDPQGARRCLRRARQQGESRARSRPASPARSTSKCCPV